MEIRFYLIDNKGNLASLDNEAINSLEKAGFIVFFDTKHHDEGFDIFYKIKER